MKALTTATEQNPKHSIALWNLSHAQRDCGLYPAAVKSCEKVLRTLLRILTYIAAHIDVYCCVY
jgi:hypothetical protein